MALKSLGHECFLVHHAEVSPDPVFHSLVIDPAQCDWSPTSFIRHARHSGLPFGVLRLVGDMVEITNSLCRIAPQLLREHNIDAIVTDQLEPAGALVADHLSLPFVSLAAAHPINREPLVPLPVLPWPFEESEKAIERNRVGTWVADKLTSRHDRTIAEWSTRWGLEPRSRLVDCLSPLADICQLVAGFDFPRRELPASFHYVGPIRPQISRPRSNDSDPRRRVFASLGTLQNHRLGLFRRIAKACRCNGFRLVLSHGNGLSPRQAASIGAEEVLSWADQEDVLSRVDAVITHGGLNTVLDTLASGLPILCLPIAFEQPGIGARIERSGAGLVVSKHASSKTIADALGSLVGDSRYRENAAELAAEIRSYGGAFSAASIIENALARIHSPPPTR